MAFLPQDGDSAGMADERRLSIGLVAEHAANLRRPSLSLPLAGSPDDRVPRARSRPAGLTRPTARFTRISPGPRRGVAGQALVHSTETGAGTGIGPEHAAKLKGLR